ncbi:MAG: 39S ribosomal protein L45 [Bacilli bacterium]|nr:39S ribosomal protein L45 [Bacilli bacterium]
MRKIISLLLITIVFSTITTNPVYARAGGGSSGGGGGGSSGGGAHSPGTYNRAPNHYDRSSGHEITIFERIIGFSIFFAFGYSSVIIIKIKLTKLKNKSKLEIQELEEKDKSWNYNDMQNFVAEAYFAIENAWKDSDMSNASNYMMPSLLENFQIKLNWMEVQKKKNIMDKIELIDAYPVSLYDDAEDDKDYVWFYIKGKMIDYTIDTETNEIIKGDTKRKSFVEYWQFKRTDDKKWALNKILQEDEQDEIGI